MKQESFTGRENEALLQAIGCLRLEVWRDTGTTIHPDLPTDCWLDNEDSKSFHFAVVEDSGPLAATRLTIYNNPSELSYSNWYDSIDVIPKGSFGAISRLVVKTNSQHRGFGKLLDEKCIELARSKHCSGVLCEVPDYRVEPLKRKGFHVIQPPKSGWYFPDIMWSAMYLPL